MSSKIGRDVTVTVAFDSVAAQNIWVVDAQDLATMKFRVISITQDEKHQFSITALQRQSAKVRLQSTTVHFIDERPISIVNPTTQAPVTDSQIPAETYGAARVSRRNNDNQLDASKRCNQIPSRVAKR